jgi:hypothetical protein
MVNEVNVGGHVGLVVDRNLDMETVNAYAESHGQNIKGTKVDGQLVIYFSDNPSGVNPISSFFKQYRGKQAIRQIMEQSWGEKVASHFMSTMKDAFSNFGDYLTRNQTAMMEEVVKSQFPQAVRQAGPQPSLAELGARADLPPDQMPPPAFSDHGFQREPLPHIVDSDADFDMDVPNLDDEDDDIYDEFSAQDGAPSTTGLDGELEVDDDEEDDSEFDRLYGKSGNPTTSVDGETEGNWTATGGDPATSHLLKPPPVRPLDHTDLPDPPVGPILRSVVAWSLEDLPEPPTHSLDDISVKSEASVSARTARRQAGRSRSASAPSSSPAGNSVSVNNRIQGMLFARHLENNPGAFSGLLKAARKESGSDLLGDGGFRKVSGADRFAVEAAISRYFANHPRPIAAMSDAERRDLAIAAIKDYINLPDPSKTPVDG